MTNVFQNPEKYAATALPILERELKGAGLFTHRYGIADYSGAKGDKIMIKRPPVLVARDAGFRSRETLVVDDIITSRIEVALTNHPYSRVGLSPEEATLDAVDYARDVQLPQVRAISEAFDASIAGALAGATFVNQIAFKEGGPASGGSDPAWIGDPRKVAIQAKKMLDSYNVPASNRYWLVGANVSAAVAAHDKLLDVNTAGIPEALRDGVVGRLAGFVIIDWPALGDNESYFAHETAVALSAVAPVVPRGAAAGQSIAGQGLAVTQVWSYGDDTMQDRSTVHAFTGATPVTDPHIVTAAEAADSTPGAYYKQRPGTIGMVDGAPVMEFVRAVKVTFTPSGE